MDESNHIIWSDVYLHYEDWRKDLEADYPDMTEDERISLMYEINDEYLDDERSNLNIQLPREIIVIGDLGLWHGRLKGYKMIESGNVKDCLFSDCEYNEWFVDKSGDLRCNAYHHDGTNHYLYRAIKPHASLSNYIDYERFGRDIRLDEGGTFTANGYIRSNGDSFDEDYDGINVPDEYTVFNIPKPEPSKQNPPKFKAKLDRDSR